MSWQKRASRARNLVGRVYKIYIHIDPEKRRLLYVGMTSLESRPASFTDRNHRHRQEIKRLKNAGWKTSQIVHVVAAGLTRERAEEIEKYLIKELRPTLNVLGNPDFDWWGQPAELKLGVPRLPLQAKRAP